MYQWAAVLQLLWRVIVWGGPGAFEPSSPQEWACAHHRGCCCLHPTPPNEKRNETVRAKGHRRHHQIHRGDSKQTWGSKVEAQMLERL